MTQDQNEKALAAMIQGTLGKLKLRMSRLHHLDDGDIWEISEILASKLISLLESQSAPVGGEDCHNAGQVDWDSIDDAMEKYATTYRSSEFVEEGTDIRACVITGGRWMKHLIKSTTHHQPVHGVPSLLSDLQDTLMASGATVGRAIIEAKAIHTLLLNRQEGR